MGCGLLDNGGGVYNWSSLENSWSLDNCGLDDRLNKRLGILLNIGGLGILLNIGGLGINGV